MIHPLPTLALFASFASLSLAATVPLHPRWKEFKTTYDKSYASPAEELRRAQIFADNMRFVDEHNQRFEQGETTYGLEMNGFSDQNEGDAAPRLSATQRSDFWKNDNGFIEDWWKFSGDFSKLPRSLDWRQKNAVTPAKNQGTCGSCYAFAALGAMESHLAIKTGVQFDLSEQQIIECPRNYSFDDRTYSNHGCHGGEYSFSYEDIYVEGGIEAEASYPYLQADYMQRKNPPLPRCHVNKQRAVATTNGMLRVDFKNVSMIMAALNSEGPLVVMMFVLPDFQHLSASGVYDNPACNVGYWNHMVVIVGYGTDAATGLDYWIIKNSWDTWWADKGFARIRRGVNRCGIEDQPAFPLVKKL